MRVLRHPKVKLAGMLVLSAALSVGSPGCGPETIAAVLTLVGAAGGVAFTINQFQQIESVQLDIEMKRMRFKGMRDGMASSVEHDLNDAEFQKVSGSDHVLVNGRVIPVSR